MSKKLVFPAVLAVLAAIFASQNPDGLDKVSQMLGFAEKGAERSSVMTGYVVPFLGTSRFSTIFAGIAGLLITYGLFFLGIFIFKNTSKRTNK